MPLSDDHKRKISIANKGKNKEKNKGVIDRRTSEQKAHAIEKSKLVTTRSAFKKKMADATRNYYSSLTPEERESRNRYKVGRKFSDKTRMKLSEKAKKRKWAEATKKKISELEWPGNNYAKVTIPGSQFSFPFSRLAPAFLVHRISSVRPHCLAANKGQPPFLAYSNVEN